MNNSFDRIAQYIKTHCQADDYSLRIFHADSHETRFAQNRVTQHLAGPKLRVNLNVAFDNKTGSASVNQDDPEALARLIQSAEAIARLNQPDPEYIFSAPQAQLPEVQNADPATRDLDPARMVQIVQSMIMKAKAMDATVSGMTEKHFSEWALITKGGFEGYDASTEFGHSMTLKKEEVETKVSYEAKSFAGFEPDAEFETLKAQAASLASKQVMEPEKIAVILRPGALMELLWFMGWMMNRRQSDEGFTPFTDQMGKLFFGENFNLYSTLKRTDIKASPFNSEGIPSREIAWVEKGVINAMPTNRYWAQKQGLEPCDFYNFYIPGGDASEEEMMKLVPRGLIINRFWYIRTVDAKAGELTGMTRDGVLYFEDGKVRHAVNNLRFNEIPHVATRRVLAMGPNRLASSGMSLPSILFDNFNFVDKTNF